MLSGVLELASALMPPPPTCGQQNCSCYLTKRRLPHSKGGLHSPATPNATALYSCSC
jgi:hypothetical protein